MEISKGMYVRTHQGIARIVEKPNISVAVWNDRKVIYVDENGHPIPTSFNFFVFEDEITASSFNLIDLIKIGDYVNGYKVSEIIVDKDISDNDKLKFGDDDLVLTFKSNHDTYYLYIEDIEDVITKEQFNSMKYVVERDD